MTRVLIFGGRGGGTIAASSIRRVAAAGGPLELEGFLNDTLAVGDLIEGVPVLGSFVDWKTQPPDRQFLAPLHKVKLMPERIHRIVGLGIPAGRWATVVDPTATLAAGISIGRGTCIDCGASLMPGSRVGAHAAIRSGAVVSHDVDVGDYAFVGANAVLCGFVVVGTGAHIAPGAIIHEYARVGSYAIIGLGAVVLADVPDYAIVAGNPARIVGYLNDRPTTEQIDSSDRAKDG